MVENNEKILVVDDIPDTLEMIGRKLTAHGFHVYSAPDVTSAIAILQNETIDLVLTDYKMPKISGLDLIRHIRDHYRDIKVIMITGYPSIEGAVEAVKVGAEEYLSKPFTDQELFRAIDQTVMKIRNGKNIRHDDPETLHPSGLVGNSAFIKQLTSLIQKYHSGLPILYLQGEKGAGKEAVARAIHYHSERAKAPFIKFSCSEIPGRSLESELFGSAGKTNEKGICGALKYAENGTVYIHDIAFSSLSFQIKLMRILSDKQYFPLGSPNPEELKCSLIIASNFDPEKQMQRGLFREDLFYCLQAYLCLIPSLKTRKDDILPLIRHFLRKYADLYAFALPIVNEEVLTLLLNYDWPGNIDEISNVIHQALLSANGSPLHALHLPSTFKHKPIASDIYGFGDKTLAEVEKIHITQVLESVHQNKSKAAKILDIDRKTLHNKIRLYQPETGEEETE